MVGQSGPKSDHRSHLRVLYTLLVVSCCAPCSAELEKRVGIRVQWFSTVPHRIGASIHVDRGMIHQLRNLSLDPGSTGGLQLAEDRRSIALSSYATALRGGLDLTVVGPLESKLDFRFANSHHSITLAELVEAPKQIQIASGFTLTVHRQPGDAIGAHIQRDHMVFDPGESIPITLYPSSAKIRPGQKLRLQMIVTKARSTEAVWEQSWQVTANEQSEIVPVQVDALIAPEAQSAYTMKLILSDAGGYIPWAQNSIYESRQLQFVVVGLPGPSNPEPPFREVASINPAKHQWWNPKWIPDSIVPNTIPIVGSKSQPFGAAVLTDDGNGRPISRLAPEQWHAYPIQIKHSGKPHTLVIRYPTSRPMKLGVSILEPDVSGRVGPLGVDSGVAVTHPVVDGGGEFQEHRVVFWPKTKQPLVVLSNYDVSNPAWYLDLRLEAGPARLQPMRSEQPNARGRMAAMYLDKPLLANSFGATKSIDPASGAALDDWQTFLDAGDRMVQYIRWAGYNSAIVTVVSEGGTLYPTSQFMSTPRFDMSIFSSTCSDISQKDVLELLYRLFDRAGIRLIPAIELATPLLALEAQLRNDSSPPGLQPLNASAQRALDVLPTQHGLAPYYNPLDSRVQSAVSKIIHELHERYQHHLSYAGLGVHLGGPTYMHLPGRQWGMDSSTLGRFVEEHQQIIPPGTSPARWAIQSGQPKFLEWKNRQLSGWYENLGRITGHPLVLLTADLASDRAASGNQEVDLREKGLDWNMLTRTRSVTPMRLHRSQPLSHQAWCLGKTAQSNSESWDPQLSPIRSTGALVVRPPTEFVLHDFTQQSPWESANTNARLFAHGVATSNENRRMLAKTLAYQDTTMLAVGGWSIPRGTEAGTHALIDVYSQLPSIPFETWRDPHGPDHGPVIRQGRHENQLYLYIVNPLPWSLNVQLQLHNPDNAAIVSLPNLEHVALNQGAISSTLSPGNLIAYRIESPNAWIESASIDTPNKAQLAKQLGDQLQRLTHVTGRLSHPVPYESLMNPDFEEPQRGINTIAGWLGAQHPAGCVQLTHGGGLRQSAAIQLTNIGEGSAKTWLLSNPFEAPKSGRLALDVHVRRDVETKQVRLRVAIEGRYQGRLIRRRITIGEDTATMPSVEWTNNPIRLEATELPIDGLEDIRVAFDLISPGRVWIDEVRLYDQFLTEAERKQIQNQVFLSVERMRTGDLSPGALLLDSGWSRYLFGLPIETEPVAIADTEPARDDPSEATTPTITDRIREWIPMKLWR